MAASAPGRAGRACYPGLRIADTTIMHPRRHALATLLLAAAAAAAAADDVHLTNGNTLEGHARRVGNEVVVVTAAGELRLPASEVREIVPGKTRRDRYVERLRALEKSARATDADAYVELGDWCAAQRLRAEAGRAFRRALELDADHRAAHVRLGHVRHEGRWLTEAQYYEARGFVRDGGAWVHRDELARRRARVAREKALRTHRDTIRSCVRRMQSQRRKERQLAKVELQEYAESIGDLRLASFASDVADGYNAQWRVIRQQLARGTALTEIRATQATLKRPIPVFTTSLGANSTPVRIQLPELAITSIRTTVLVPLDIELDEDD